MVKLHFARRGEVWHVDFRVGGVRYRMTTGETDRDAAEEVGRARLDNVLAMLSGRKDQTTLGEALDHYVEYLGPRYTLPVFPRLKRRGPIEARPTSHSRPRRLFVFHVEKNVPPVPFFAGQDFAHFLPRKFIFIHFPP